MDLQFVGLTATSTALEVAIRPTGEIWKTQFAEENIEDTIKKLKSLRPKLVVMEALGTVELSVAGVLAIYGLPFAIINPRHVRDFVRAVGRRGRFDRTQAGLLAHFGELVDPEPRPLSKEIVDQLKQLRTRRDNVRGMLLLEREHLTGTDPCLKNDVQRHIDYLEQNIAVLNQKFNRTVLSSPAWR
ncbi:MAG TPA: transposase [Terriglobia bacterium]